MFEKVREDIAANDLISPLEQRRLKYMKKKVEFGARQDEVSKIARTYSTVQNLKLYDNTINISIKKCTITLN